MHRGLVSLAMVGTAGLVFLLVWPATLGGHAFGGASVSQADSVTIAVDPGAKSAAVGESFTLDVRVNAGAQQVDAVDVFLSFSPAVLQVVDAGGNPATKVTAGSALKQELQNKADNAMGQIDLSVGRAPSDSPATGSFVVASVRFKGTNPGGSPVSFALTPHRQTGVYLVGNNLLSSFSDGAVIVTAASTGTPGASPTATPPSSGGGGGGAGGGSTPTPTATATRTPTAAATAVASSAPAITGPADGVTDRDMAPRLSWSNPPGATQYHVQVLPAPNPFTGAPDGPGIDLIIGDPQLVAQASYQVQAPRLGAGNYVLLPGMTYTWRVRTTTATLAAGPDDPSWGPWSSRTFRTPSVSSTMLSLVSPSEGSTVASRTPTLQWANSDSRIFYYEVQVSKDPTFTTDPATATAMVYWELRHGGVTSPNNSYAVPAAFPLESGTKYYWRVRPRIQGDGTPGAWSARWSFQSPP